MAIPTLAPHSPAIDTGDGERFLPSTAVCARYGGRSAMWLHRTLTTDPAFPRPVYLGRGRLRFWRLSELVAWENAQPGQSDAVGGRGGVQPGT